MRSEARAALGAVGLAISRLGRLVQSGPAVRILYYHSISDDPVRSSVSPAAFEGQMAHVRNQGYRVLHLSDVVRRLAAGAPLPDRALAVTLDDGFRDNYDAALPVLVRFEIPATVFLTAGYIGTDRLPTLTRTDFVPRPLDWRQVAEMQSRGVEFGSHTLTHPMLSTIPAADVRREVGDSKRLIEDKLGVAAPLFCYPRGDFDDTVKSIVREQGYEAACSILPGVNGPRTDLFALRRTYVSRRDTPREFARKLDGAYDLLQQGAGWARSVKAAFQRRPASARPR